jgi:hypothetical protein
MSRAMATVPAIALALSVGCSGSGGSGDEGIGQISIAIEEVPQDVHCVRIVATGSASFTRSFDVAPGTSSSYLVESVPVGSFAVSGKAYASACGLVAADSVPSWTGGPTQALVQPGQTTQITLNMLQTGNLGVGVDFDGGAGDLCAGIDCDDGNACTVDTCDPATGCVHELIPSTDDDGDGYGVSCGDCNDADPSVHPGATEVAGDGIDENCDGQEVCYRDSDGDGWASTVTVVSVDADCGDPGEALASARGDCCDSDARAHPGFTPFYTTPTNCGGYDYDCNFRTDQQYFIGSCSSPPACTAGQGFLEPTDCGQSGVFLRSCVGAIDPELRRPVCEEGATETRTQGCR